MAERKLPPWYSEPDFLHARIDLSQFERGSITLLEPSYDVVEEFAALLREKKCKGIETTARSLAIFVEKSEDPSFPSRGSPWQKFADWLKGGIPNILVERIGTGIQIFRNRDDEVDVPN